jgi:uncharacterized sporulation protein YeaH/YhbH (DUF444 family)
MRQPALFGLQIAVVDVYQWLSCRYFLSYLNIDFGYIAHHTGADVGAVFGFYFSAGHNKRILVRKQHHELYGNRRTVFGVSFCLLHDTAKMDASVKAIVNLFFIVISLKIVSMFGQVVFINGLQLFEFLLDHLDFRGQQVGGFFKSLRESVLADSVGFLRLVETL